MPQPAAQVLKGSKMVHLMVVMAQAPAQGLTDSKVVHSIVLGMVMPQVMAEELAQMHWLAAMEVTAHKT